MLRLAGDRHVGSEGQAFDLGGDVGGIDALCLQGGDKIDEQGLGHGFWRQIVGAFDGGDVGSARQIDVEQALEGRCAAVAQALAVALIDEEFVIVDGQDFADARIFWLFGRADIVKRIGVFVRGAAGDIDSDDADVRLPWCPRPAATGFA
jgi:hypothetical protein